MRLTALRQRMVHASARLTPMLRHGLALAGARLQSALRGLHTMSPLATLARGYAIVTVGANGEVLRDAGKAAVGTQIDVRLARGRLKARILGKEP